MGGRWAGRDTREMQATGISDDSGTGISLTGKVALRAGWRNVGRQFGGKEMLMQGYFVPRVDVCKKER